MEESALDYKDFQHCYSWYKIIVEFLYFPFSFIERKERRTLMKMHDPAELLLRAMGGRGQGLVVIGMGLYSQVDKGKRKVVAQFPKYFA